MILKLLSSGYWHARWSSEIWAQWPSDRLPDFPDFFHDTGSPLRLAEIARAMEIQRVKP